MTKDFYEDALALFTRKEDQDELKAWHHGR